MADDAAADEPGVRLRVLVSGLTFFAVAMLLAVAPVVARGHSPNLKKPCTIEGTGGPDYLKGTAKDDVICGFGGDDVIGGLGGDDIIRAGGGSDRVQGDGGRDVLMGGRGNDYLWARDGLHDHVLGGRGYDRYRIDKSLDRLRSVEAMM